MFVLYGGFYDLIYYRKNLSDYFKKGQLYQELKSLVIGDSYKFMLSQRGSLES